MKALYLVTLLLPMLALALSGCGGGISEAEEHYNAGAELQEQRRHGEAIAEYHEVIRLDPQHAEAYYSRGLAYFNLGQHQRAIQDYDEAIRLNPRYGKAYNNRGLAYKNLGQHQRAIEDLDEAIRLNPQYTEAYSNRGSAYIDLKQHQRAIEDLDEAIRLNPQLAEAYSNRGAVYNALGQYERAIPGIPQIKPTFLGIAPSGIPSNIIPHSKGIKCGLIRSNSPFSYSNHRPAKPKIPKPLVYAQVSPLGTSFATP